MKEEKNHIYVIKGSVVISGSSNTKAISLLKDVLEGDDTDLADYAHPPLDKKLTKIEIGVEMSNKRIVSVATCHAKKPLGERGVKLLKEYLSGQYSDGWGECFEQNTIGTTPRGKYYPDDIFAHFYDEENPTLELASYDYDVYEVEEIDS